MSDDAFHLTPHDVRAQEFGRVIRGYDPVQVDEFKGRVSEELERLLRDRVQFEERLKNVQEQLKAYRERERALNEALVAAQQLRADSKQQSEREAESILRTARQEAEQVIAHARQEAATFVDRARYDERAVRERGEAAARQFTVYVASFRALLERQLAELDVLQGHATTITKVQAEALEVQQS